MQLYEISAEISKLCSNGSRYGLTTKEQKRLNNLIKQERKLKRRTGYGANHGVESGRVPIEG